MGRVPHPCTVVSRMGGRARAPTALREAPPAAPQVPKRSQPHRRCQSEVSRTAGAKAQSAAPQVPKRSQPHRRCPQCLKSIPAQLIHTFVSASIPATRLTTTRAARPTANSRSNLRVMARRTSSRSAPSAATGPNKAIQW